MAAGALGSTALPPAEVAVHPADGGSRHELYLMCDDIRATLAELQAKGVELARDVSDQGWACWQRSACPTAGNSRCISLGTHHRCNPDLAQADCSELITQLRAEFMTAVLGCALVIKTLSPTWQRNH
jgi:hypothetical protein